MADVVLCPSNVFAVFSVLPCDSVLRILSQIEQLLAAIASALVVTPRLYKLSA